MNLKDNIIHESLRLFSLKGYASASITDILAATNSSKGGFYNHFASKEDLFLRVLDEAQCIWRKRVLLGVDDIADPIEKIECILRNYKDHYLNDSENFPGGCVFVTFSVELDDQFPHLAQEVNKGFLGFKNLLKRLLDEAQAQGKLKTDIETEIVAEVLFSSMLGASVLFGVEKSSVGLGKTIQALIEYLDKLKPKLLERNIK